MKDLLNASMQKVSLPLEQRSEKAGGGPPRPIVWSDSCSRPALLLLDRMKECPSLAPPLDLRTSRELWQALHEKDHIPPPDFTWLSAYPSRAFTPSAHIRHPWCLFQPCNSPTVMAVRHCHRIMNSKPSALNNMSGARVPTGTHP